MVFATPEGNIKATLPKAFSLGTMRGRLDARTEVGHGDFHTQKGSYNWLS